MTTFTLYKGKNGDTYLRALGKGRIKMDGGEGITRKSKMLRSLWKTIEDVQLGNVYILDETGKTRSILHEPGD